MLKNLFSPMRIGKMEVSNRLVVPAMVMNFCNNDGTATEKYIAYHEAKAKGGWGLIITGDSRGFLGCGMMIKLRVIPNCPSECINMAAR